jgi:hypothetical protein
MTTIRIQFMTGETLPVFLEKAMTQRQFYRMVYEWLLPEEIRPPAMWQMMLLREGGWIQPTDVAFQVQEGDTLYLLVNPRSYEMDFEYAYLAQDREDNMYDAIYFRIREGSGAWKQEIFYMTRADAFYRKEAVTVLGLSREFSMPRWFNWPYPVEEYEIAPIPRDTPMYNRMDVLLDHLEFSVSDRDHLVGQIQERWEAFLQRMDELGYEQQEQERIQERELDW